MLDPCPTASPGRTVSQGDVLRSRDGERPPAAGLGEEVYVLVDSMPVLIGGLAELQKRVHFPDNAKKDGVEGRVIVQFVVDEYGIVIDPLILRGLGYGVDEEVVRVIREARFTPGLLAGKAVKVRMALPFTFRFK